MEPFHPEAPEASSAEAEKRRQKRDKERLLQRLRRWKKERQAPVSTHGEHVPSAPLEKNESETRPTQEERKGKVLGRLLKFAIRRPTSPDQPPTVIEQQSQTPETSGVSPRHRWIRRITHRALDRVVETHDEVKAVVKTEVIPSEETQADEASLQTVEWELRRVSDQFDDALARVGARAESFQAPIEDDQGFGKKMDKVAMQPAASQNIEPAPLYDNEVPGPDAAWELPPAPSAPTEHIATPPPIAETQRVPRTERPRLGSTVVKATAAGIAAGAALSRPMLPGRREAQPIAEQAAQLRVQAEQLRQNKQALDRLQHEKVDMRDARVRHQRVQETVTVARSQAEVVTQETQYLQAKAEQPIARIPSPHHLAPPVAVPSAERHQSVATPGEVASAEYYTTPPHSAETIERQIPPPVSAAEFGPAQPLTKETVKAPTERELADRAERNPGRNWKAHQAQDARQAVHDQQTGLSQSTLGTTHTNASVRSGSRQASPHQPLQPSKSWLLVAVLVIVIAGLVMLSLSL